MNFSNGIQESTDGAYQPTDKNLIYLAHSNANINISTTAGLTPSKATSKVLDGVSADRAQPVIIEDMHSK